jgi:hypothetical protein
MKNKRIKHARQETKIYENYYRPSLNLLRFLKSILGVVIFGRSTVASSYVPGSKRVFR